MKLLYFGDPHARGTSPRNRLDDYKEALINKLLEIFDLAKKHDVEAILQPGDTFDRPEVSIAVLLEFAEVFKQSPVPIYTTAGNHDIFGYNLDTYGRTSLKLLEMLVPQLHVRNDPNQPAYFGSDVQVTFTPYSGKIDLNGYGYSPVDEAAGFKGRKIHIAHGMLLDHTPPFDRFTLIDDVQTAADLVINGHDHLGYGIKRRKDGVLFANPGSITRLSASLSEIERDIQVMLIDTEAPDFGLELIKLESAAPGDQVLDRSKIEQEQQRQYSMEQFALLIQDKVGGKTILDVNQIVETIAQEEGLPGNIVELTLAKIDEQREKVGVEE